MHRVHLKCLLSCTSHKTHHRHGIHKKQYTLYWLIYRSTAHHTCLSWRGTENVSALAALRSNVRLSASAVHLWQHLPLLTSIPTEVCGGSLWKVLILT